MAVLGTLTEIADAIRSTDVAKERIAEINSAADAKKEEVLASIPPDYKKLISDVDGLKSNVSDIEEKFGAKEDVIVFNAGTSTTVI